MNKVVYFKWITYCFLMLSSGYVRCTIDVNISQYKYLASHLEPKECKRLVAALHSESYDLPKNLDSAEKLIKNDMNCLELLLMWNSDELGGKGRSHEPIGRRLRQLGHKKLADWLAKSTIEETSNDLANAFIAINTTEAPRSTVAKITPPAYLNEELKKDAEPDHLDDAALFVIIVVSVLASFTFIILSASFIIYQLSECRRSSRENKNSDVEAALIINTDDDDYEMECLIAEELTT